MECRIMNLLQQCRAMLTSPTGKPNLAPWSKMVVAGGSSNWSSEKKAFYIQSTSSNSDVYTPNYTYSGNYIKLTPGHYRLTCRVESASGKVRVLIFYAATPPGFSKVNDIRQETGIITYDFDITESVPWVCVRFGTTEYNQTVYLYWTRIVKLY